MAAVDSRDSDAERKVVLPMGRVDPDLVKAIREGTYVVDPHAVAGAIIARQERRAEAQRLATVLEAGERNGGPVGGSDDESGPLPDVA